MRKTKTLIVLGVIVALTIGATALWATIYTYTGTGDGTYGNYHPFVAWSGAWCDVKDSFGGTWTDVPSGVSGTFSSLVDRDSFEGYWYFGTSSTPSGDIRGYIDTDTVDGRWYAPANGPPYTDSGKFWDTLQ